MPRLRFSAGRTLPVGISRTPGPQSRPVGASGRTRISREGQFCLRSDSTHRSRTAEAPGQATTAETRGARAGGSCGSSDS